LLQFSSSFVRFQLNMKVFIVLATIIVVTSSIDYDHCTYFFPAPASPNYQYDAAELPRESIKIVGNPYSEENTIISIEKLLKETEYSLNRNLRRHSKFFFDLVDKKCVRDKYDFHNLTQTLERDALPEDICESPMILKYSRFQTPTVLLSFNSLVVQCFSKLDSVLEFMFENLMSYHNVYKSFVKEPALRNYTSYIWCANKYAVDHHIIDETIHGSKLKLDGFDDDFCQDTTVLVETALLTNKLGYREKLGLFCSVKVVDDIVRHFIRTILLVQVDMSFADKKAEREGFVKTTRKLLEDIVDCGTKGKKSEFVNIFKKILNKL
jgi:hypothetical protein